MRLGLIRVRTRSDVVAPYPYRSHRTVADLIAAGAFEAGRVDKKDHA